MKKRFSWQLATVKELAEELDGISATRLNRQVGHYRDSNSLVMLERIDKAKKLLKYWQILRSAEELKGEIKDYL